MGNGAPPPVVTVKSIIPGRGDYHLTIGQRVKIHASGRRQYSGVVETIGTKLVHIREQGVLVPYRLADQHRRDGCPGRFETEQQAADAERRQAAVTSLRKHGIEVTQHEPWTTLYLVTLADIVDDMKG
jgi:hypothetical protein